MNRESEEERKWNMPEEKRSGPSLWPGWPAWSWFTVSVRELQSRHKDMRGFFFFLVDWQLLLWLKTGILSVLHRGSLICSNSNVWFSFPPYKPFFLASASKMLSMRRIFLSIKVICSWAKTGWCIFRGIKGKTAERTHSSATLQFCSKIWHKSTLS